MFVVILVVVLWVQVVVWDGEMLVVFLCFICKLGVMVMVLIKGSEDLLVIVCFISCFEGDVVGVDVLLELDCLMFVLCSDDVVSLQLQVLFFMLQVFVFQVQDVQFVLCMVLIEVFVFVLCQDVIILILLDFVDLVDMVVMYVVSCNGGVCGYGILLGFYILQVVVQNVLLKVELQESGVFGVVLGSVVNICCGFELGFMGMLCEIVELVCGCFGVCQQDCIVVGFQVL